MAVKLVFLGRLEDAAATPELAVAPGSLPDVLSRLEPELAAALSGVRIKLALNGSIVTDRAGLVLADGDELAFLPPVSGG